MSWDVGCESYVEKFSIENTLGNLILKVQKICNKNMCIIFNIWDLFFNMKNDEVELKCYKNWYDECWNLIWKFWNSICQIENVKNLYKI